MVFVKSTKRAELLETGGLSAVFYYSLRNLTSDAKLDESKFKDCDLIALRGYKRELANQTDVKKEIEQPSVKGMGLANNIYRYIGVLLASDDKSDLEIKFSNMPLKSKFAVSLFFPDYKEKLIDYLKTPNDNFSIILKMLTTKQVINDDDRRIISDFTLHEIKDIVDYVLFEEAYSKFNKITITNLDAVDVIKQVLNNFQNSIKHITSERRKGKIDFSIIDEYDIQDISYTMLKGIFPTLEFENPHYKVGGTSSRIDLMLKDYGIDIELKMIKSKDSNESEIIKQIKEDFSNYPAWKDLKNLIVFVYDPQNKTRDQNNFKQLEGDKSFNGVNYYVDIIVSN